MLQCIVTSPPAALQPLFEFVVRYDRAELRLPSGLDNIATNSLLHAPWLTKFTQMQLHDCNS